MELKARSIQLIHHRHGGMRLRLARGSLAQLQALLNGHSFWARGRSKRELKQMLKRSDAVVSAWKDTKLIGFGRATSDWVFRATLWDVVVAEDWQGQGVGRRVVESLLKDQALTGVERIYLMTTNSCGFYEQLGFKVKLNQQLMLLTESKT